MGVKDIWILAGDANRDLILGTELDYFEDHFVGRPMSHDWEPPPIDVIGKSKRLREFVSWNLIAPVVSQKAKDALELLISKYVEFLPLIVLRNTQYWAINVTYVASGCIDLKKSEVLYSPSTPGKILSISKFAFNEKALPDVPIFKASESMSEVFVRKPFVDAVIQHGLRGAAFADPAVDPFGPILRGQSVNVVPGIPE